MSLSLIYNTYSAGEYLQILSLEEQRNLIGGKALGLVRLHQLGLPTPPAFVITTDMHRLWVKDPAAAFDALAEEIGPAMEQLQDLSGRVWGGTPRLLVSVRSGAPVSMPGMMDTKLNVGREKAPWKELRAAITAVLESWMNPRAIQYRSYCKISPSLGTAVIIQAMVDGTVDAHSGTGVIFTRNPTTGANEIVGEFLPQATGDAVVGGTVTPQDITALHTVAPGAFHELMQHACTLEIAETDIQDIEFTVQSGGLYILQTRTAKCQPEARAKILIDLVEEDLITSDTAVERFDFSTVASHLYEIDPSKVAGAKLLGQGVAAVEGTVAGVICHDSSTAVALAEQGYSPVLIRPETVPDDLPGMIASTALITYKGGSTSHAAIVARQLNKPCIIQFNGAVPKGSIIQPATVGAGPKVGQLFSGDVVRTRAQAAAIKQLLQWQKEVGKSDA